MVEGRPYLETTEHWDRVSEFMKMAGQHVPAHPTLPDYKTRELRAKLILEEALETIRALGVGIVIPVTYERLDPSIKDVVDENDASWHGTFGHIFEDDFAAAEFEEAHEPDLARIVDGCADISVVTVGTLIACGVADRHVLALVDENNLAKFGPGCSIREDGKVIKPPGHKPPDFESELKRQEHL